MRRMLLLLISLPVFASEPAVHAIAYHDVKDHVTGDYDPDQYAVSTDRLIAQFTWLRENGFQPVSVETIIAAEQGRRSLPQNAVLLTFDDGLASVYSRVYPLLKLFNYPAVVSVVTSWVEMDGGVAYANRRRHAQDFLTWEQLREMQASGLVEIASHTHSLHTGISANPQGNLQPAVVTRFYDGERYESADVYRARLEADLAKSAALIKEMTGRAPRAITWPYGKFNEIAVAVAAAEGMSINLTLEPETTRAKGTLRLGRSLIIANPDLSEFSADVLLPEPKPIIRAAQVDLDYVYDPDPTQQKTNLDRLLDRIKALEITHVFLQAYADQDADGGADALYFPNRHLPMRADLFSRVAWQLKTRADVDVFAWLPMLSFVGGPFRKEWRVLENRDGKLAPDSAAEPRLTPFEGAVRGRIAELYEDLAIHANFDGLLFHDDGRLNDFEDFNDAAMRHFARELGRELTPELLEKDDDLHQRWSSLKSRALIELSHELADRVRIYRPSIKTARNLFASALLDEAGRDYLAQDFDEFLAAYDFVALMAMPQLENVRNERGFYAGLVDEVARRESGFERTIFELQTVDWIESKPIDSGELRQTMRWLQSQGVRNLGYYPDDFIAEHPDFIDLRLGMSLADEYGGAGL